MNIGILEAGINGLDALDILPDITHPVEEIEGAGVGVEVVRYIILHEIDLIEDLEKLLPDGEIVVKIVEHVAPVLDRVGISGKKAHDVPDIFALLRLVGQFSDDRVHSEIVDGCLG